MASIKHLVDIDLNKNQLTNVKLQHISGNPSGSSEAYAGRLFYDSNANSVKFHDGTNFVAVSTTEGDVTGVGAGTGLTGTDLNGPVPTLNVVAGTGLTANADNIQITNGGVDTTQLADDAVTADKLANAINSAIAANTAKNTNVSTNLSVANSTTSRIIASSDGTNATIPVATTSVSGVMSTTIFDAVTANTAKSGNATHTGDVTGSGSLTIAADAVTYAKMQNLATANRVLGSTSTGVIGETQIVEAMIANDAVTADKLANSINSAIAANTAKNTNVSTNLSLGNSNAARTLSSSDGDNVTLPVATTSISGLMSSAIFDAVTANTAKTTNTDVDVSVGNLETRLSQINSNITIGNASTVNTTISGDLIVNGDTTTITSTIVAIGDNMMKMAKDNSANSVDIGWYGKIVASGNKFPAMFYDASTGVEAPVFNVGIATTEPGAAGTTIAVKGTVNANLTGNVTGNLSGNVTGNTSGSAGTVTSLGAMNSGDVTSGGTNNRTLTIGNSKVTLAKMANLAADKIVGRANGAGTGVPTALSAAQVRTIINVENGATADQTKGDIDGLAITTVGTLNSGNATAIVSAASVTAAGKVELATTDEALAGADTARAVTPAGLAARSFKATVGGATTINVDHGLNTRDVIVQLYDASSYDTVYAQVVRSTAARVVLTFNVAPASNDIIVLVTKVD